MHFDTPLLQRYRDTSGADRELQCRAVPHKLGEELDGRFEDRRVRHRRRSGVVELRDPPNEDVLRHGLDSKWLRAEQHHGYSGANTTPYEATQSSSYAHEVAQNCCRSALADHSHIRAERAQNAPPIAVNDARFLDDSRWRRPCPGQPDPAQTRSAAKALAADAFPVILVTDLRSLDAG